MSRKTEIVACSALALFLSAAAQARMRKPGLSVLLAACALASVVVASPSLAHKKSRRDFTPPLVFQAAGPTAASIQSMVDAYRAALGAPNDNAPGPILAGGRREINWDGGGGVDATTDPVTPFDVFLNTRGAQFTTPGDGLTQAPPSGGPQGGLAALFDNPSYGTIFATFSPLRLFTPVDSNVTDAFFFIPGTSGGEPATVSGFGAVFTDVDRQDEGGSSKSRKRGAGTRLDYFDVDGRLLFSSFVPASPGDASLSFFGVLFDEPLVGSVRITTGNDEPGRDDEGKTDIVVMDDFIYGEPQPIP